MFETKYLILNIIYSWKKAPRIINEEMLSLMKKGSIICDLAVEQGGNCIYSESGKVVEKFGIKILGYYVGFLVTQRMLSMYKKRIKNDFI